MEDILPDLLVMITGLSTSLAIYPSCFHTLCCSGWHPRQASDGRSYIVYEIKSTRDGEQWVGHKRYSDFVQLRQDLKCEAKLPKRFPIRNLLSVEIKEEEKIERQNLLQVECLPRGSQLMHLPLLQVFLVTVVGQSNDMDYRQKHELGMFLGMVPDEKFPTANDLTSPAKAGRSDLVLSVTPSASPNVAPQGSGTPKGSKWLQKAKGKRISQSNLANQMQELQRELSEKDTKLVEQTAQARALGDQLGQLTTKAHTLQDGNIYTYRQMQATYFTNVRDSHSHKPHSHISHK